ncbi:hypothetical protein JYK22_24760, partial [Nonomuraea sp. RK-328]|nr:hypothetical protein [Nonomuraea sp. RK-328]
VTTWIQDYPALSQAADAASRAAYTVTNQHLPGRASDAYTVVESLFAIGLERTAPGGKLNLITVANTSKVRFELHYLNDQATAHGQNVHGVVSGLADAYGEKPTRCGRMIYAELWAGVSCESTMRGG